MDKAQQWLTMASTLAAAISYDQCPYRFDHGRRSTLTRQAQGARKRRNKAQAKARKRNR